MNHIILFNIETTNTVKSTSLKYSNLFTQKLTRKISSTQGFTFVEEKNRFYLDLVF